MENGNNFVEDLDEETLIKLVKKNRELYDCTLPKYTDVGRKEKIWNEIAEQIGQPVSKCRDRWANLRGSFRRAYRDHKGINDRPRKRSRRWKYEKQMEFIIPYLKIKYDYAELQEIHGSDFSFLEEETSIKQEEEATSSRGSFNGDFVENSFDETTRRQQTTSSSSSFTNNNNSNNNNNSEQNDALTNFFVYLAETVRTFPPFMQVMAKNKCFNFVSEMEINLVKQNPDQCVIPQITIGDDNDELNNANSIISSESEELLLEDDSCATLTKI